jgi:flagellar protein FliO/FliZ
MGETLSLFLRLGLSLAVVIGIMAIAGRTLRKRGVSFGSGRAGQPVLIDVVARRGLSRSSAIAIVKVPGKHLVVGITENAINVLGELDHEEVDRAEVDVSQAPRTALVGGPQAPGTAWKTLLDTMRDRTVRRR